MELDGVTAHAHEEETAELNADVSEIGDYESELMDWARTVMSDYLSCGYEISRVTVVAGDMWRVEATLTGDWTVAELVSTGVYRWDSRGSPTTVTAFHPEHSDWMTEMRRETASEASEAVDKETPFTGEEVSLQEMHWWQTEGRLKMDITI